MMEFLNLVNLVVINVMVVLDQLLNVLTASQQGVLLLIATALTLY